MIIAYDTEFLENGRTIDLISIGMAADDGRELYLINEAAPLDAIQTHAWLLDNVVPSLPLARDPSGTLRWNTLHPDYAKLRLPKIIAEQVAEFILATREPQLWAYFAAYDHVALAQLWGRMTRLPEGVPMWTNDLKQECERLGNPTLPPMPGVTEHNALSDAREVLFRLGWLRKLAPSQPTATPARTEPTATPARTEINCTGASTERRWSPQQCAPADGSARIGFALPTPVRPDATAVGDG